MKTDLRASLRSIMPASIEPERIEVLINDIIGLMKEYGLEREPGYYWVKTNPNTEWLMGHYDIQGWITQYSRVRVNSKSLHLINEERIVEPKECE